MISDRDLDAQLAAAARVHDADLPPLPPAFLDDLRAVEPASVLAARQLVDDAHHARTSSARRPRRRTIVRVTAAVVAVAAAWTTAVLVTPRDDAVPPGAGEPTTSSTAPTTAAGAPGQALTLVATEAPTFPLSLDPEPAGVTATFSRWGGTASYPGPLVFTADFTAPEGDRFLLRLFEDDPRDDVDGGWSVDGAPAGTGEVDGYPAEVRQVDGGTSVLWERPDGRWVQLLGEGFYDDADVLLALAGTVVDRPQPVGLQFGLAPAGWSVSGYEESRSLDLVSDTDPAQVPLRVSLSGTPGPGVTVDTFFEGRRLTGPVEALTVQGLPARLGRTAPDDGDSWLVAGQVPDGRLFLVVAPPALTREQVLEIAEEVTVTP